MCGPKRWILLGLMGGMAFCGARTWAQEGALSLKEAIRIAIRNNYAVQSADEAIRGAEHQRKSALADFFPKLSVQGNYTWLSETPTLTQEGTPKIPVLNAADPDLPPGAAIGFIPATPPSSVPIGKRQTWAIQGSVKQPVFTGGALLNQYRLSRIGVESARTVRVRVEQDLALEVVKAYFNVLNAIELKKVADQAVRLLENQREVARQFYRVGMIPKNDLLKTEVQLAERVREQIRAENAIELAKSQFNLVLQRPIHTPVHLENILEYKPSVIDLEQAIRTALKRRPEIREAQLKVAASQRRVRLAQSAYFPQIQLTYNLFKTEGASSSTLEEGWTLEAGATWTFWEWGKKYHDVHAAKSQLLRDRYALLQLRDQIALEVKKAYLELEVAERNILVALKAIEQGEENFRMNQERYKEQVGTITDVLDAQTLLTQAQTDYYNALRNHNVAKAALRRAMGVPVYPDQMPLKSSKP